VNRLASLDIYTLIATLTLTLEIAVFVLLIVGFYYKRKLKFRLHGTVMASAVALHLITILGVMIPSFVLAVVPDYIIPEPLLLVSLVGLIHGIFGIIAISLGVYLVAAWGFKRNVQGCFPRKKIMLTAITLWLVALLLGFLLYGLFYGMLLIG
jgi:uncharacterized membrane protein YozB (DUF420 family)